MIKKIFCLFLLFIPFKSPKKAHGKRPETRLEKSFPINNVHLSPKNEKSPLPEKAVLEKAFIGYYKLAGSGKLQLKNVLTIIDFSLPSTEKRMWVVEITTGKTLYYTYVAHGKNSGAQCAESFSNKVESHQSSLGFYITGNTYSGKHGLSLYLDGQEKNINDLARKRDIVMHGASYVSEEVIQKQGYLGRSFGCPALPLKISREIIKTIEGGSALFIFAPDKNYISTSEFFN